MVDALTLGTTVQDLAAQVGNRLLQGIEAVIEGQERLLAEEYDCHFLGRDQHGRSRFLAAYGLFGAGAPAPLAHRFEVEALVRG